MTKIKLTKQFIEENLIRADGIINSRKLHLYTVDGIDSLTKVQLAEAYTEMKRPTCSNPDCNNLTSIITYKEGF